jgi:hypothetical protein
MSCHILYVEKYLTMPAARRYVRVMHINRPETIWGILAFGVGLLAAILTLHMDNLQYAFLFLFVQGAIFGFARPERPWRWACLIAVAIPLAHLLNVLVTLPSPRDLGPVARLFLGPLVVFFRATLPIKLADVPASCMTLLPTLAGAYGGAWMSRLGRNALQD